MGSREALLQVEDVDWNMALAQFKVNGFVVFDNMLSTERVDAMHAAFSVLLDKLRKRDGDTPLVEDKNGTLVPEPAVAKLGEHGDIRTGNGRLQQINRYTCNVPWVQPFADREVYEHPVILEFLQRYWGDTDFRISCYHSNTPVPGSQYQHWHRDANTHGIDRGGNVTMQNCPHFGIKIPLVDTTEENGSFEVLPGSQYLNEFPAEAGMTWDDVLNAHGRTVHHSFAQTRRLNLKKGSMWVQDPRALHRGTPNTSGAARPELVICYTRNFWQATRRPLDISPREWKDLQPSARGLKMLEWTQPVQPARL